MCDSRGSNSNSSTNFMLGAIIGAALGAAAAYLLTPTTGDENRKRIATSAKKYKVKSEELLESAKSTTQEQFNSYVEKAAPLIEKAAPYVEKMSPLVREVEQKLKPYLTSAKQTGHKVEQEVEETIQQLITDTKPAPQSPLIDQKQPKTAPKTTADPKKRYFKRLRK